MDVNLLLFKLILFLSTLFLYIAEEGVIEEIRYFGSEITYISVIYSGHPVNTHETFIDDKENLSKKPDLINSRNNYLVIGLQSRLVIIKQLQSG